MNKTQGQTDKRILSLSFKDFEEEFGFKPEDKIEQRYFATHGMRLTDEKSRKYVERHEKLKKDTAKRREQ